MPGESEWRVHFHLPVHSGDSTTQAELRSFLDAVVGGRSPVTCHLEVETYTWAVLPPGRRPVDDSGLVAGLAAELSWVRERLEEAGLSSGARAIPGSGGGGGGR